MASFYVGGVLLWKSSHQMEKLKRKSAGCAALGRVRQAGSRSGWDTKGLCSHSEGPWQAGAMSQEHPCAIQQREVQSPATGRNKPLHQERLGSSCWNAPLQKRTWGILVDTKVDMSQKQDPAEKQTNGILSCIRKNGASRLRELYSTLMRPCLECLVPFWALLYIPSV